MKLPFLLLETIYILLKLESLYEIRAVGFSDLSLQWKEFLRNSSKAGNTVSQIFYFLETIVNVETNDKIG